MPDSIRIELCSSDTQFLSLAGEYLAARPAEHALIDDALSRHRAPDGSDGLGFQLLVALRQGKTVGFAVFALPRTVFLPVMHWSAAAALASEMARRGLVLPTVIGPDPCIDAFASAWTAATEEAFRCRHELVLYETRVVLEPRPVEGRLRRAERADLDLVTQWQEEFVRETKVADDIHLVSRRVAEQLKDGRLYVWDVDGIRASIAHSHKRLAGARLYGVYTPVPWRGRGYATAMTAALTRSLLATGHERCILFADAHNPTSNQIYARIGYRERGRWKELERVT
ncbi:MAG: hypothetical protein MUC50_12890 [Myxococcota bacterium]|jgi:predicted GNAT family acetyltransferase|nr:hypothetical protein [Myxococcota bacterium]